MAGAWKVFALGPMEHARSLFVEPYAHTFLPRWALWTTGTVVPVVELVAGGLLLLGLWTRGTLLAMPRSEDVLSLDGWLRRRRTLRPQ